MERLENVAIVVEEEPGPARLHSLGMRANEFLLGLYEGVSQSEGGKYHRGMPDRITIFQRPIEALARTDSDVERMVAETVRHEIAHHFGMDEGEVRRAEQKGRKRKSHEK